MYRFDRCLFIDFSCCGFNGLFIIFATASHKLILVNV